MATSVAPDGSRPRHRGAAAADQARAPCARTGGGCSRSVTASVLVVSSSTRPGRRSRTPTTSPAPTSRRSTRRAWPASAGATCHVGRTPARDAQHSVHVPNVGIIGTWWPISPAILILIFPLGFRLTCYYYRAGLLPVLLAVTAGLRGGRAAQALHRRDPVPAHPAEHPPLLLLPGVHPDGILTYDAVVSFRNAQDQWGHMGLGTLVLLVNAVLLWLYSLSCHSCRHIIGGRLKHFSRHPVRFKFWGCRLQAQRSPHAAGVGQPGLRRPHRPLRPAGGERHDHRSEVLLRELF